MDYLQIQNIYIKYIDYICKIFIMIFRAMMKTGTGKKEGH